MAKSYVELIADKKRIKPNSLYKSNGKTALTEISAEEVTINGFTFKYTLEQLNKFEQLKVEHDLQVQTLKEVCVGILLDCGVDISHLDIKTSSVFDYINEFDKITIIKPQNKYVSLDIIEDNKIVKALPILGTVIEDVGIEDLDLGFYDLLDNKAVVNEERKIRLYED